MTRESLARRIGREQHGDLAGTDGLDQVSLVDGHPALSVPEDASPFAGEGCELGAVDVAQTVTQVIEGVGELGEHDGRMSRRAALVEVGAQAVEFGVRHRSHGIGVSLYLSQLACGQRDGLGLVDHSSFVSVQRTLRREFLGLLKQVVVEFYLLGRQPFGQRTPNGGPGRGESAPVDREHEPGASPAAVGGHEPVDEGVESIVEGLLLGGERDEDRLYVPFRQVVG